MLELAPARDALTLRRGGKSDKQKAQQNAQHAAARLENAGGGAGAGRGFTGVHGHSAYTEKQVGALVAASRAGGGTEVSRERIEAQLGAHEGRRQGGEKLCAIARRGGAEGAGLDGRAWRPGPHARYYPRNRHARANKIPGPARTTLTSIQAWLVARHRWRSRPSMRPRPRARRRLPRKRPQSQPAPRLWVSRRLTTAGRLAHPRQARPGGALGLSRGAGPGGGCGARGGGRRAARAHILAITSPALTNSSRPRPLSRPRKSMVLRLLSVTLLLLHLRRARATGKIGGPASMAQQAISAAAAAGAPPPSSEAAAISVGASAMGEQHV